MSDDRELLGKPQWVIKRKVIRAVWALMFILSSVLATMGTGFYYYWDLGEQTVGVRLFRFAVITIILVILGCIGVWYAYWV